MRTTRGSARSPGIGSLIQQLVARRVGNREVEEYPGDPTDVARRAVGGIRELGRAICSYSIQAWPNIAS